MIKAKGPVVVFTTVNSSSRVWRNLAEEFPPGGELLVLHAAG
jgi:hypothetical protein